MSSCIFLATVLTMENHMEHGEKNIQDKPINGWGSSISVWRGPDGFWIFSGRDGRGCRFDEEPVSEVGPDASAVEVCRALAGRWSRVFVYEGKGRDEACTARSYFGSKVEVLNDY